VLVVPVAAIPPEAAPLPPPGPAAPPAAPPADNAGVAANCSPCCGELLRRGTFGSFDRVSRSSLGLDGPRCVTRRRNSCSHTGRESLGQRRRSEDFQLDVAANGSVLINLKTRRTHLIYVSTANSGIGRNYFQISSVSQNRRFLSVVGPSALASLSAHSKGDILSHWTFLTPTGIFAIAERTSKGVDVFFDNNYVGHYTNLMLADSSA
jgi:hypothetical protein